MLLQAEDLQIQADHSREPVVVTLALKKGDSVSITGIDQSGKSALLRVLAKMAPAASGCLFWNDVEVTRRPRWTLGRRRKDVMLLWADPYALFANSGEVRQIFEQPDTGRGEPQIQEHLQAVGLSTATLNVKIQTLSGAQRVRLALAYARQRAPKVLLVDDLFARLAPEVWPDLITRMKEVMVQGALVVASRYAAATGSLMPLNVSEMPNMSSDTLP